MTEVIPQSHSDQKTMGPLDDGSTRGNRGTISNHGGQATAFGRHPKSRVVFRGRGPIVGLEAATCYRQVFILKLARSRAVVGKQGRSGFWNNGFEM